MTVPDGWVQQADDRWVTERQIEVPFLLSHAVGPRILDVGRDRVGYTESLVARGWHVVAVDPIIGQTRTDVEYGCTIQDMPLDCDPFNTILVVSTLEHFDWSEENLATAAVDIDGFRCIQRHLAPGGRIIFTIPFGGVEYIDDGFVNWTPSRRDKVFAASGLTVQHQEVWLWDGGQYIPSCDDDLAGVRYKHNGASNAGAVLCTVLVPSLSG